MKKRLIILCMGCAATTVAVSQSLFTYGGNEVSKDEFVRAFNKNSDVTANKEQSVKEYLQLYTSFKQKVAAAREMKLDTTAQLRYDMLNFRNRLAADYTPALEEVMTKTGYKRNTAVADEMLYLYADSIAYSKSNQQWPVAKETIFSLGSTPVKGSDWLTFAKEQKLVKKSTGSNKDLLQQFINTTTLNYYRTHLEDYNADFRYEMQEFKEGNLLYEIMGRKVWNKSSGDDAALRQHFETNKAKFAWNESAAVILINAKSYAYADYAFENMKKGMDWQTIVAQSEGTIQGDSARFELLQLPVKKGAELKEGAILDIVKNTGDNGASFIKVIRLYPAAMPRSFEEARAMVVSDYQRQLEENWTKELVTRYPVKVNTAVLQSLLR